jgi:hypothetical protein
MVLEEIIVNILIFCDLNISLFLISKQFKRIYDSVVIKTNKFNRLFKIAAYYRDHDTLTQLLKYDIGDENQQFLNYWIKICDHEKYDDLIKGESEFNIKMVMNVIYVIDEVKYKMTKMKCCKCCCNGTIIGWKDNNFIVQYFNNNGYSTFHVLLKFHPLISIEFCCNNLLKISCIGPTKSFENFNISHVYCPDITIDRIFDILFSIINSF